MNEPKNPKLGGRKVERKLSSAHREHDQMIQPILREIVNYLQKKGVLILVILFGSRATETATVRSDIDILAIFKDLSTNTALSPPENLPIGVDILAVPEKNFREGLTEGKGVFIEVMTRGRVLFGKPQVIQKYQTQVKRTINQLKMERTEIGWKRDVH